MLKRKIMLLATLLFVLSIFGLSDLYGQDEKMKAIFLYNYTRYISWPQKSGDFVIYVVGKSPIIPELQDISTKKKVGNSTIMVQAVNTAEEVGDGHIVYITASKSSVLPGLLSKAVEKNLLIITEKPGLCKAGSGINFVNKDGKLTFEINRAKLVQSALTVSTSLYGLGVEVSE